jgi:hypothetical protein
MEKDLKDLLLKDLCARLPYGVKFMIDEMYLTEDMIKGGYDKPQELYGITCEGNVELLNMDYHMPIESIKPYLFPISSMTAEQLFEVQEILGKNEIEIEDGFLHIVDSDRNTITYLEILALLEWFYKNHFDIYGLIEKSLALDATGLNIY